MAVERPPEIEAARSQLPIIGMEQEVVEAVLENDVVVLSGETGCGKTTQVTGITCSLPYTMDTQRCAFKQPRRFAPPARCDNAKLCAVSGGSKAVQDWTSLQCPADDIFPTFHLLPAGASVPVRGGLWVQGLSGSGGVDRDHTAAARGRHRFCTAGVC